MRLNYETECLFDCKTYCNLSKSVRNAGHMRMLRLAEGFSASCVLHFKMSLCVIFRPHCLRSSWLSAFRHPLQRWNFWSSLRCGLCSIQLWSAMEVHFLVHGHDTHVISCCNGMLRTIYLGQHQACSCPAYSWYNLMLLWTCNNPGGICNSSPPRSDQMLNSYLAAFIWFTLRIPTAIYNNCVYPP